MCAPSFTGSGDPRPTRTSQDNRSSRPQATTGTPAPMPWRAPQPGPGRTRHEGPSAPAPCQKPTVRKPHRLRPPRQLTRLRPWRGRLQRAEDPAGAGPTTRGMTGEVPAVGGSPARGLVGEDSAVGCPVGEVPVVEGPTAAGPAPWTGYRLRAPAGVAPASPAPWRASRPMRWDPQAGMATAELAVAMPAVVLVLLLVLSGVSAGVTQLRVTDAARVAARAAAIGESDLTGAANRAGGGVGLTVEQGEFTCVTASRRVPGPLGGLGLNARSRACAYTEPSGP